MHVAFLRISIDLDKWEKISVKRQERIVGREKSSGCQLDDVTKNDTNVFVRGCPIPGTTEIIQKGNEEFLEGQSYYNGKNRSQLSDPVSKSHIGRMIAADSQIFRQGFDFLEPMQNYPFFRAGLNFVSFQKGTDRIYWSIRKGFERINFGGGSLSSTGISGELLAVHGAGLFLVPPFKKGEDFPGEIIFEDSVGDLEAVRRVSDPL